MGDAGRGQVLHVDADGGGKACGGLCGDRHRHSSPRLALSDSPLYVRHADPAPICNVSLLIERCSVPGVEFDGKGGWSAQRVSGFHGAGPVRRALGMRHVMTARSVNGRRLTRVHRRSISRDMSAFSRNA
jgi:hypothetical protein